MKYRALIRLSYNKDKSSRVRNYLVPKLEAARLRRRRGSTTRTATWEGRDLDSAALLLVADVLKTLADPSARVNNVGPHFKLDHVWIYVDQDEEPKPTSSK